MGKLENLVSVRHCLPTYKEIHNRKKTKKNNKLACKTKNKVFSK